MKYIPLILIALLVFLLNMPLREGFFVEDDFDHLLATQNGTEFSGRPGWFNYTPVTAIAWLHALHTGTDLFGSYSALRIYSFAAQLLCGFLLFYLASRHSTSRLPAFATAALFLFAPLTFEVRLRLNCLHYWFALVFMFASIAAIDKWISSKKVIWLVVALLSLTSCLFSSIHGLLAIPCVGLYVACFDKMSFARVRSLLLTLGIPIAVLLVVWLCVFLHLPVDPGSYQGTTIGGRFVTFFNVMLSGFTWHPGLWIAFAERIGTLKILGRYPILFLALCAVFTLFLAALVYRSNQERRWAAFCLFMLLAASLVPPKSYWMPRYSFLALPWAAALSVTLLDRMFASSKTRYSRVLQLAFVVAAIFMGITAYAWHERYTRQHLAAAAFVRVLYEEMASHPVNTVVMRGVPQWIGSSHPWPSCTSWIDEINELLLIINRPVDHIDIAYRTSDQCTNMFRVTRGHLNTDGAVLTLKWNSPISAQEMNVRTIKSSVQVSRSSPPAADP